MSRIEREAVRRQSHAVEIQHTASKDAFEDFRPRLLDEIADSPDTIGPYHRTATLPVTLQDKPVWEDYGLKESEAAAYENEKSRFTVTVWRLADTTEPTPPKCLHSSSLKSGAQQ